LIGDLDYPEHDQEGNERLDSCGGSERSVDRGWLPKDESLTLAVHAEREPEEAFRVRASGRSHRPPACRGRRSARMTKNVMTDFGAIGDNVHDDASDIQKALDTGDDVYLPTPPARYKVGSALRTVRPGQKVFGDHRLRSMLSVAAAFPGSGVITAHPQDPGPVLQDFGISFLQPDTNVRSSLTVYPPAIFARNSPRILIDRVYIERATVGVDLGLHSGQSTIRFFECSAFDKHVFIDEAFDTMRLDHVHLGPWGATANQLQILNDPGTHGVVAGRVDDLKIHDSLIGVGTGMHAFRSSDGTVSAEIVGTGFEIGGIDLDGGFLVISGGYFAIGPDRRHHAIKQTGGDVTLAGVRMNVVGVNTQPMVAVSGGAGFVWAGGTVFLNAQDRSLVRSDDPGTTINLSGITVFRNPDVAYSQPTFWKAGGMATIIGTVAGNDFGNGSCTVIRIDGDNHDCVMGNALCGGRIIVPPSPELGVYGPNGR
jgi:hypothetical protein